jgi:glucosamine--fructose-6-phosphate aminotransferase (isomerizing)
MCGIVGYVGRGNATPFLLEGLAALEYRGYDSAGIYVAGKGVRRRAGKVAELVASVPEDFSGSTGIAHTRWATHGPPTEANAHPHADSAESVWLVHNGIIENHAELRKMLAQKGAAFRSETDTEVLAELIGTYHTKLPLEEAVATALAHVRGTYGIAVASRKEPDKLVAARLSSPLLIGIGKDEYYIASDATPVLKHTRDVVYLDDGEMAVITADGYEVRAPARGRIVKKVESL